VRSLDELFARLEKSTFRRRFRLSEQERSYLNDKGLATILDHARQFVLQRLAMAEPRNDGKQTPLRNHPVFVAQHATATCCRGCLAKWHGIVKGQPLREADVEYILSVIERWLRPYLTEH
jgi:hypothetical protein